MSNDIIESINQSIKKTFARAPVTDEHWCRTSDLIKLVT